MGRYRKESGGARTYGRAERTKEDWTDRPDQ
jgi:hypothetical protein